MALVDSLLDNAEADRDLLRKNLVSGDRPELPRDADFVLYAADQERAELVCAFVHDNSYGRAIYQYIPENQEKSQHRIVISIFMPTTENVLCVVSGFMVFLAKLYSLEYDGWGCSIQTGLTSR
jgi:hypothetical protein